MTLIHGYEITAVRVRKVFVPILIVCVFVREWECGVAVWPTVVSP